MQSFVTITVRLPAELAGPIREAAAKRKVSINKLVVDAVSREIKGSVQTGPEFPSSPDPKAISRLLRK